jgi:hypothetical protein
MKTERFPVRIPEIDKIINNTNFFEYNEEFHHRQKAERNNSF